MTPNQMTWFTVGTFILIGMAGISMQQQDVSQKSDDPWYQHRVVQSDVPVVLKFTADWCGACHAAETELKKVESQFAGRVRVVRVNVDEKPELAAAFNIHAIPKIMLIQDGRCISTFNSRFPKLPNWVERHL